MNKSPYVPQFKVEIPPENIAALHEHKAQFPLVEAELIKMKQAGIDTTELEKNHREIKDKINKFLSVYGVIK